MFELHRLMLSFQGICDMFKRAIRTLADEFTPLISSVSQMVAQMYSASLQGALLDLAKQVKYIFPFQPNLFHGDSTILGISM